MEKRVAEWMLDIDYNRISELTMYDQTKKLLALKWNRVKYTRAKDYDLQTTVAQMTSFRVWT